MYCLGFAYSHPIGVYLLYDECMQTIRPLAVLIGLFVLPLLINRILELCSVRLSRFYFIYRIPLQYLHNRYALAHNTAYIHCSKLSRPPFVRQYSLYKAFCMGYHHNDHLDYYHCSVYRPYGLSKANWLSYCCQFNGAPPANL